MGLTLNRVEYGTPGGVPLMVGHGLFGAARNWRALARRFALDRHVVCVDMRNHGASPWSNEMTYAAMADDLAAVIADLGGRADVLGHSMGGKAAMVLAVTRPALVRALVVGDIAPVPYAHSQRPAIAAMRALPPDAMVRRSAAQAALTEATGDAGLGAFLAQSIDTGAAPPRWTLNLDALDSNMEAIIGFPADLDGQFDGPTLFLTGARSDYVRPEHAARIRGMFPNTTHRAIAEAGHWLHADKPQAFIGSVNRFLGTPG